MCQNEKCTGRYGEAYQGIHSVAVEISMLCPKCATRIIAESFIHFGGERWEPFVKCPSCEWGVFIAVIPKTVFPSRMESKEPEAKEEA